MYGKKIPLPRLTAWHGEKSYIYSGIVMKAKPWTEELLTIKKDVEKKAQERFNGVLLNYYRSHRDNMGWHCDDEVEFAKNPIIASVSLGAERIFRFRHLADYKNFQQKNKQLKNKGEKGGQFKKIYPNSLLEISLPHNSLLIMAGETQHQWQHEIKKIHTKKQNGVETLPQNENSLFFENGKEDDREDNFSKNSFQEQRINLTFRNIKKERRKF